MTIQAAFGGASDGSSAAVDLSRLCVVRAKHAWELGVHVALMSCGGGELVAVVRQESRRAVPSHLGKESADQSWTRTQLTRLEVIRR